MAKGSKQIHEAVECPSSTRCTTGGELAIFPASLDLDAQRVLPSSGVISKRIIDFINAKLNSPLRLPQSGIMVVADRQRPPSCYTTLFQIWPTAHLGN
jgi:hypothetical protein